MSGLVIEWHGWDSTSGAWHGPDELDFSLAGCRGILGRLRQFSSSWTGRLGVPAAGRMPLSLWASVRDLGDAGLAVLDADGSPGGPLEVVLVAPVQRRPQAARRVGLRVRVLSDVPGRRRQLRPRTGAARIHRTHAGRTRRGRRPDLLHREPAPGTRRAISRFRASRKAGHEHDRLDGRKRRSWTFGMLASGAAPEPSIQVFYNSR